MLLVGPAPKGEAPVGDAVVMGVKDEEAGMGIMAGGVLVTGQLAVLLRLVPLKPSAGGEDADTDTDMVVLVVVAVEEEDEGCEGGRLQEPFENHLPRELEERGWAFTGGFDEGEGVRPGVLLDVPGVSAQLVSSLDMAAARSSDCR